MYTLIFPLFCQDSINVRLGVRIIGTHLVILRADGKTTEVNNVLKISASWHELSFLSNFNILIGILFGPNDLVESIHDIMRSISSLPVELK